MYTRRSGLIIGFHGCDKTIQEKIIRGEIKDLDPSENSWDWLGHGIYFWENNYTRALDFAREQSQRPKPMIITPAVIGAVVDLGYCLDLMDMDNIILVKKSYESLKSALELVGKNLPQNKNKSGSSDLLIRHLDCAVINSLNKEQDHVKPFDSVKGIFTEGNPIYPDAGFREKDHIQFCIRNTDCIKGYFLPREKK